MIELRFQEFHAGHYEEQDYCIYVMKNGLGDVLYVGMTTVDIWSRWFGWGGHVLWDGHIIAGESPVGVRIENHLPDSLNWIIQLWTLQDAIEFCGLDTSEYASRRKHDEAGVIAEVEIKMMKKLRPALNVRTNLNPGKDTTPKSKKEIAWERYVDKAYDEIFNKRSTE